jgi:hypothetical protein
MLEELCYKMTSRKQNYKEETKKEKEETAKFAQEF